jgi:ABC-2 type transport system ATP-binding protein
MQTVAAGAIVLPSSQGSLGMPSGISLRRVFWDLPEKLIDFKKYVGLKGMAMLTKALSVRNLQKAYGDLIAVEGISFDVGHNEIVGLLGPNGAGKTTTINMVLGVLEPDRGTILIEGTDIAKHRSEALGRSNFAAVYAPLPGNLTVYQNLRIFGLLYGVADRSCRIEAVLRQFGLGKFRDVKCGVLSSGEQTRVGLAKALLNNPSLLLLDEPTASLDPAAARDIRMEIREFVARGSGGVLWTSHNMNEVEEVCDRVLFLSRGRILLEGDPKTLPGERGKESLEELFISVSRAGLEAG